MTDSASITVTNHRLRKAMSNANDDDLKSHTKKMGEKLRSELSIKVGEVTKIYPLLDKAEVKVLNSNKIETCLIAHDILSEGMNVIGFPKGKTLISENGQTYIIPSEQLYGVIMTMDDKKNEKILLSFISLSDKTVFQNAKAGEYKIQVEDNLISVTDKYINIKSNNLFINGLPYTEAYTPLTDYHDKEEINQIVNPYIEDTGWNDLEIMDGFVNHSEKDKAQYRRIGKTVQIRGALKNTSAYTPAYDGDKIAQLPDNTCYPSQRITTLQQGTGANKMMVRVDTDGAIVVGRYGTSGVGQINANSWLNIQTMYFTE